MLKKIILPLVALAAVAFPSSALKYRGMVDISPALEFPHDYYCGHNYINDYGYDDSYVSLSVSTTHGVQLSKNHFIGIGGEFSRILGGVYNAYYKEDSKEKGGIPVYAMWRMDFFGYRWTPFFDLRAGYTLGKGPGLYAAADIGVRLALGRRSGLNFSLGGRSRRIYYTLGRFINEELFVNTNSYALTLRIGIDF